MQKHIPPMPIAQPSQKSFWPKLRARLILWGILAPPGDLAETEQARLRRFFFQFRRHPGGR